MIKLFLFMLFGIVFYLDVFAQKPNLSGLVLDENEYEQLAHTSENVDWRSGRKALVSKKDLSPYCPEIRHQGDISSCVGWSLGYGAMTIERAIKNDWTNPKEISENANSALFVYNQISKGNCNMGISLPQALELVRDKGNCLAREFDHEINDCAKPISGELEERALNYRIDDYIPLFRSSSESEEKIDQVKLLLAQDKPVVVGLTVLNNFYQIRDGEQTWVPTVGDKTYAGGHAMVVVGYDDNKFYSPLRPVPEGMRGAFKLMNSWGKKWGERGFIWVRYAHFAKHCKQAFALLMTDAPPINYNLDQEIVQQETEKTTTEMGRSLNQFGGQFGFQHFIGWDNGPVFQEAGVLLNQHVYQLNGDWSIGDKFQLQVKSGFSRGYVYVFSIDALGKTEVHFPRSEQFSDAYSGQVESALILEEGGVLTIPSKDEALELSKRGTEYLIALFSLSRIKPAYIKLLAEVLAEEKSTLKSALFEVLEEHQVPFSDIAYRSDLMGFEVSTRSAGRIVPIILEVQVR